MKEFLKWLGVNEKVAKLAVWIFIFMFFLIVVNAALDSFGLPYYKVTIDNLSKIKLNKVLDYLCTVVVSFLNFFSIVFLVLRVKEFKKIWPYAVLYLFLLGVASAISYIFSQIFLILFIFILIYLYKNKDKKYLVYTFISFSINLIVQYLFYLYKAKLLDFSSLSGLNKLYTFIDSFLIMFIVIFVKEVYFKNKEVK